MATSTKYCNTYDTGVAFATSPANLVDGNTATFASSTSVGDIQENYFTTGQLFAIPTGSTINGIVVKVQHYEGAAGDILAVRLCTAGTPTGTQTDLTNRASTTLDTLGSSTDMWGTTWTVAEINASGTSGFGVELTYIDSGKNVAVYAAYVEVTVYYTEATTYTRTCAETIKFIEAFKPRKLVAKKIRETVALVGSVIASRALGALRLSETLKISDPVGDAFGRIFTSDMETLSSGNLLNLYGDPALNASIGAYWSSSTDGARRKCYSAVDAGGISYITIPSTENVVRTASFWMKISGWNTVNSSIINVGGITLGYYLSLDAAWFSYPTGYPTLRVLSGVLPYFSQPGSATMHDRWMHIAVVYGWEMVAANKGHVKIYIDGALFADGDVGLYGPPTVGNRTVRFPSSTVPDIMIDEVTLFTRALEADEIAALRVFGWYKLRSEGLVISDRLSIPQMIRRVVEESIKFVDRVVKTAGKRISESLFADDDGLEQLWSHVIWASDMSTLTSGKLQDMTKRGITTYNATGYNGITFGGATGKFGNATNFVRLNNEYAIIDNSGTGIQPTKLSVSFWARLNANYVDMTPIAKGRGGLASSWYVTASRTTGAHTFFFWVNDATYAWSETIPDGRWVHIVGTYDPAVGSIVLYTNGGTPHSWSYSTAITQNTLDIRLGEDTLGNDNTDGLLEEVLIFDKALSADEVAALYHLGGPLTSGKALRKNFWMNFGKSTDRPKETVKFTDTLRKTLGKRARETFKFYDVLTNHKTGVVAKTITETLALVDRISHRWFDRRIRDTLKLTDIIAKRNLSRKMRETSVFTDRLGRRSFFKRLPAQTLKLTDTIRRVQQGTKKFRETVVISHATAALRKSLTLILAQTLSFVHATPRKFFAKRLGPSHLYALWDSIVWATDGETAGTSGWSLLDCSRNGTYYQCNFVATVVPGDVTDGKYGHATSFEITKTEYGVVANSSTDLFQLRNALTVAVWFRTSDQLSTTRTMAAKNAVEGNVAWQMYKSGETVVFKAKIAGLTYVTATATIQVGDGQWHLAVGKYDSTSGLARISIDGCDFVDSPTSNTDGLYAGNGSMYVASQSIYNLWLGDLDDVIYFNKALTQDEVTLLYLAKKGLNLNQLDANKSFWGPTVSDNATARKVSARVLIIETIRFVERISKRQLTKVMRETTRFVEATVSMRRRIPQVIIQTLKLVDTVRRAQESRKRITETLKVSHATAKKFLGRKIRETLKVYDSLRLGRQMRQSLTQAFVIVDRLSKRSIFKKARETLKFQERMAKVPSKRVRETAKVQDVLSRRGIWKRIVHTLKLTDRLAKSFPRRFSEALRLTDRVKKMSGKRARETMTFTDRLSRRNLYRKIRETTALVSGVISRVFGGISLIEHITIAYTVSFRGSRWVRKFSETVRVSTTTSFGRGMYRALTETVRFVDGIRKTFSKKLTASYPYALWDGLLWAMDGETTGTTSATIKDMAANGTTHEVTLHGYTDVTPVVGGITGHFGNATYFYNPTWEQYGEINGSDVWADQFGSTGFTLAMWMRPAANYVSVVRMDTSANWASPSWKFGCNASRMPFITVADTSSATVTATWPVTLLNAVFYLIVVQYDPSVKKARVSVNGGAWVESSALSGTFRTGLNLINICRNWAFGGLYTYALGYWDDMMLWNRVLTQDEVTGLYNAPKGLNLNEVVDKFSEGGGLTFLDTLTRRNNKYMAALTQTISFTANLTKRTFSKIVRDTVAFGHTLSILTALRSVKFNEGVQFVANSFKTSFKKFRETGKFTDRISRRSFAKVLREAPKFVDRITRRGFTKRLTAQTLKLTDSIRKSQRRLFRETTKYTDSIRKTEGKRARESITASIGIVKRTMSKVARETLWVFDLISPSGQRRLLMRETIAFAERIRKGFSKRSRETVGLTASATVRFIIRKALTQTIKFTERLSKTAGKRLNRSLKFSDSSRKSIRFLMTQSLKVSDRVAKRERKLVVQSAVVSDRLRKTLARVIRETPKFTDIVTLLHGYLLTKSISEVLKVIANSRKSMVRRIRETAKFQASYLRNTKVVALVQSIQFAMTQAKGFFKRLGAYHFYRVWDALLWASDGETAVDAARNLLTNCLGLMPITAPPTRGGVTGHYGNATELHGLTGADNGQYGTLTDPLSSTSLISLAVWFKELGSDSGYIIAKGNTNYPDWSSDPFPWGLYKLPFLGSTMYIFSVNGAADAAWTPDITSDSNWHLLVACYDQAEGKIKISIDGSTYYTTNYSTAITQNSVAITVGRFAATGDTPANLEAVEIDVDDLMLFGRTLTEGEISALYASRVGLNLNNFTAAKHTWGMPFTETVSARRAILGIIAHETIRVVDRVVKRASISMRQTLSLVGNITRRGFKKVIRQTISIPAIVHTYHSGYLQRFIEESIKFVGTMRKGEQIHLRQTLHLDDWLRTIAGSLLLKALSESIRITDRSVFHFKKVLMQGATFLASPAKRFSKRLGPNHLYDIWNVITCAYDMETQYLSTWRCRDAATSNQTHYITFSGTSAVAVGGISGKYGSATECDASQLQSGKLEATPEVFESKSMGAVMAWVYVGSAGLSGTVVARRDSAASPLHPFRLRLDAGVPQFLVYDTTDTLVTLTADSAISTGAWHLLVATWDVSEGLIKLSVDGDAFKTAALGNNIRTTASPAASSLHVMGILQTDNLTGRIDDVALFTRVLAIGEAQNLYLARKGLNLNNYTSDKAFWGTSITDITTRYYTRALSFQQTLVVVDRVAKGLRRVLSQTAGFSDRLSRQFNRVIIQSAGFSDRVRKSFNKSVVQTTKFTDTFNRTFQYMRRFNESVKLVESMRRVQWKMLRFTETLRFTDTWNRTHHAIRRFIEQLRVTDIAISEVTFTILTVTPLAGTFPRPARIATMSLKVSTTTGIPISGCRVSVSINKPDGVLWKTLTLAESAYTPGIYSSNFSVLGSDPIGSFPFTATARYGLLSVGTYSGFITIFQGALAAIHFR